VLVLVIFYVKISNNSMTKIATCAIKNALKYMRWSASVKPIYNRYYNMYISIGSDGGGREYHAIQGRLHQLLKRTALVKKRVQFCNFFYCSVEEFWSERSLRCFVNDSPGQPRGGIPTIPDRSPIHVVGLYSGGFDIKPA
jgi:hypothetical protein